MSALALVAHEWGAEVGGSDRARSSYVERLEAAGIPVAIGHDAANVPDDAEVIVSSAIAADNPEVSRARVKKKRAELLAELVELRPSIVVAGAHGKTTTTAMIAFVLDRLGLDPAFLIGGEIPQLAGNARAGEGWLVAEGDESDRSLELLRPQIAVLTNVELDHHATFASEAEVRELFEDWLARAREVVRGDELEPVAFELAVPGEHNRRNAATALAALEVAGVAREEAERVLPEFAGAGRRFELRGERRGVRVYDDYGHHPREVAVTLAAARASAGDGRVLVVFQPHLYSRTRYLAHELAQALAAADAVAVTSVYAAREEPVAGVEGSLVVEALASERPGDARRVDARARGCGSFPRAAGAAGRCRADDRRGRRRARRTAAARGAHVKIEEGVELSRFTTLGAGGPAKAFARPESVEELEEALAWAREQRAAGGDGRPGLELARRGRRLRRARAQARRRAGRGACRRRAAARGWRCRQRGLPAPRARSRARRFRVRVRDPRHDRRRRLDERRGLRQRLGRDSRPCAGGRRAGRSLVDARGAGPQLSPLGAAPRPGRRTRRVHAGTSCRRSRSRRTSPGYRRCARPRSRRTGAPSGVSSRTPSTSSARGG